MDYRLLPFTMLTAKHSGLAQPARSIVMVAAFVGFIAQPADASRRGEQRTLAWLSFTCYAVNTLLEMPHTKDHLTLWLAVFYGVSQMSGARQLASPALLSALALPLGYLMTLAACGDGSWGPAGVWAGFVALDVSQVDGDVAHALERSFILHFLPAMLMVAGLTDEVLQWYADSCRESLLFFFIHALVAPLLVAVVYEQVQVAKHGDMDIATHGTAADAAAGAAGAPADPSA